MRYGALLGILFVSAAYAQDGQKPTGGPQAAPRVPEAATDVPVKAPGPTTGNPTAAGPSTGASSLPTVSSGSGTDGASTVLTNPPQNSSEGRSER
jgi:hypothetical protein